MTFARKNPMRKPTRCRVVVATAAALIPVIAAADNDEVPGFVLYAAEQYDIDNNLYRLPAQFSTSILGTGLSREDHINSVSAGGNDEWRLGGQLFDLDFRIAHNQFLRNSDLSNTSGVGKVNWNWRFSPFLSGDLGADFTRSLAGFANTRFSGRDLVDTGEYFADAHFKVASHWQLNAGVRNSDTTHSLQERVFDNFRARSGNFGVEYVTSNLTSVGVDYRYTNAVFPYLIRINGASFDRSYHDSATRLIAKIAPGGRTTLDLSGGYLQRSYPESSFGSFSGTIWRANLDYQIGAKTQILVSAWRDLTAYLDAESDYFVSRGVSVAPTWNPVERVLVSLDLSWSTLTYIGSSPSVLDFASRRDKLRTEQLRVKYLPRDWIQLELSYRMDARDSNQVEFPYSDKLLRATIAVSLGSGSNRVEL